MSKYHGYGWLVVILVYGDLPWKIGWPKVLQQPILGTQFLNPG